MKITCLNCGVQYLVEASQVKPEGTKVRCSECNMIFLAYPPASIESDSALSAECPGEFAPDSQPTSDTPSQKEEPVRFTEKSVEEEAHFTMPSDASKTSFAVGMSGEPSYLRIDDEKEREEEASFKIDKTSEKEDFSFGEKEKKTSEKEGWSQNLPPEFMEALPPKAKTTGLRIIGHIFLVLILVVLVSVACLLVSMRFLNVNLPPWAQKVIELPILQDLAHVQPHTGPTIALVKGSGNATRVLTEEGNRLLIITGQVQNISKTPQGFLTADVQLFQKGTPVLIAAQSFYCGNKMNIEEIKVTPIHEIEQRMQQPFGENRSNASVLPKAKIGFMAIMKAPEIPVEIIVQAGAAKPIQ